MPVPYKTLAPKPKQACVQSWHLQPPKSRKKKIKPKNNKLPSLDECCLDQNKIFKTSFLMFFKKTIEAIIR
jgi:hypothetical protein